MNETARVPQERILGLLCAQYTQLRRLHMAREVSSLDDDTDFREMVSAIKRRPDAFAIYPDERRVDFFEVEVTHRMGEAKLYDYAKLVTDMDYYGVELNVYVVNQYGHVNRLDLFPYYIDSLGAAKELT